MRAARSRPSIDRARGGWAGRGHHRLAAGVGVVGMLVMAAISGCGAPVPATASWTVDRLATGTVLGPASLVRVVDDTGRGSDLAVDPTNTAAITVVPGTGGGRALQFPSTGRATLTIADRAVFDPGLASFEVRARVSATPAQISPGGSNVIQKGLSGEPQWKLQLDDGIPSCAFADTAGKVVIWAGPSPRAITDGRWYEITCRKTATEVSIRVQLVGGPAVAARARAVRVGTIASDAPLTVGSKGTPTGYDQFRGRVDDLRFTLL